MEKTPKKTTTRTTAARKTTKKIVKKPATTRTAAASRPRTGTAKKQTKSNMKKFVVLGVILATIVVVVALIYGYYNFTRQKALATYDGGKVTSEEFLNVLRLESGKYNPLIWKKKEKATQVKMEILNDLIKEHILNTEAERLGIKVSSDELDNELNSYKSGYTDKSFKKMLELQGITYKDWAKRKKQKYLAQKVIKQEVIDKIQIDPKEIKKYYNSNIKKFNHAQSVRARHILFDNWEQAQKVSKELSEGANFAALAKQYSISPERWKGGDLGYFEKGIYPEVFDRVCFNTPIGEVSQPVKSEYGYHIFKVIDKRPAHKETLDEATKYITLELKRTKSNEAFEKWYKPIYEKAEVQINNDILDKIEVNVNE